MKLTKDSLEKVERETAAIVSFPFATKDLSITHIKVFGRHPFDKKKLHIEHKLTLICYVINGDGKFVVEDKIFKVTSGDAILILPNQKYYIKGNLEYLVSCSPAYYREQHEQVKI